jgi:hypothetical protein
MRCAFWFCDHGRDVPAGACTPGLTSGQLPVPARHFFRVREKGFTTGPRPTDPTHDLTRVRDWVYRDF